MKRIITLLLVLLIFMLGCASAENLPVATPEAFLTDLYTVDLAIPTPESEKLGAELVAHIAGLRSWLSDSFGSYCTQEVLDDMLNARFPFSLAEGGLSLEVTAVELEQRDPETAGEGRWFYQVTAAVTAPDSEPTTSIFTGRLTQDPATGLITHFSPDHP